MSMPSFPVNPGDMTREDAINQIISSVAMEELGLSHILNAEGEKLQYVLGTLTGSSGLNPSIDELLKVNGSVQQTLSTAMQNQMFLQNKMSAALNASSQVIVNPPATPPPAVPKEFSALHLQLVPTSTTSFARDSIIPFDHVALRHGTALELTADGVVTINTPGAYAVSWDIATTTSGGTYVAFAIKSSKGDFFEATSNMVGGALCGSCVIIAAEAGITFSLVNSAFTVSVGADSHPEANLVIHSVG